MTSISPQSYGAPLEERSIDNFFFTDVKDAALLAAIISDSVMLSGMSTAQNIEIILSSTIAEISVNNEEFSPNPQVVENGDQIRVRLTTGNENDVPEYARIDIGGVWHDFAVSTFGNGASSDNIALNKNVSTNEEQETNQARFIYGGLDETRWANKDFPSWIKIDLGKNYAVGKLEIILFSDRAYQFELLGSEDGETFFTLIDVTNNTLGGQLIEMNFASQLARYVRIIVNGSDNYFGN